MIEKQKQHFANMRAKQQTLGGTPVRPKIFGEGTEEAQDNVRSLQHASNSAVQCQRQSRLEAFDDFAPVVGRLSSMTPRRAGQNHIGSDYRIQQLQRQEDVNKHTQKLSAKRKRSPQISSMTHRSSAQAVMVYDENELDRQRKQLLTRKDWVGLQAPDPLQLDFVSNREKENFRKRRGVQPLPAPDPQYVKRAYVSSIKEYPGRQINAVPSESIQIKIGDDALTSRMSQTQHQGSASKRASSPLHSSSSMLFDDHAQVVTETLEPINQMPKHTPQVVKSDSTLARLNPNTPTRDDIVEATDEEYGNSSKYEWPTSSGYGRVIQKVHDYKGHTDTHEQADPVDSLPLDEQGYTLSESETLHESNEDPQIAPNAGFGCEETHNTDSQNVSHAVGRRKDNVGEHLTQRSPNLFRHSAPRPPKHFSQPQLLSKTQSLNTVSETVSKQHPTVASVPPTPASLAALNLLSQTKAPQPSVKPIEQTAQDDADAAWKAFVFGIPKSPSMNNEATASNLTKAAKPPTASMEVRPPTPVRKQRSSSILTSIHSESSHADAKTTVATVARSSSSAFQSDERAREDCIVSHSPANNLSPAKTITSDSDFDRVSSVANASTIPAVLRTDLPVFRRSSPDPLSVDHDVSADGATQHKPARKQQGFKKPKIIFNRPRPFRGAASDTREERHEVVYIGHRGNQRARELLKEAENEVDETEDIEDI